MASAGWVFQLRENARKSAFSSGGNVAEKVLEVKAGKILVLAGRGLRVAGGPLRDPPQPTNHDPRPTAIPLQSGAVPRLFDQASDSLPHKIKHASDL
jgi:hypothetical protein